MLNTYVVEGGVGKCAAFTSLIPESREDATPYGPKKYGFKAQEILALEGDNPVIINNDDIDNLKLTSAHLIPVLVNAIKELKAEIELLKNK